MLQIQQKIQRQEKILYTLDDLSYATRKQLQTIEGLGGDRNAHRILYEMEQDHLISSIRTEQKIYFISNKGKGFIGSHSSELKKEQIHHILMRNDLYIKLGMPKDWKKELPVTWGDNKLIPDATFKRNGSFTFVEIDNQQTMATNADKIKKYKDLFYIIHQQYNHRPTLIWYTLSEIRKKKLKELCEKSSIKYEIYGNM